VKTFARRQRKILYPIPHRPTRALASGHNDPIAPIPWSAYRSECGWRGRKMMLPRPEADFGAMRIAPTLRKTKNSGISEREASEGERRVFSVFVVFVPPSHYFPRDLGAGSIKLIGCCALAVVIFSLAGEWDGCVTRMYWTTTMAACGDMRRGKVQHSLIPTLRNTLVGSNEVNAALSTWKAPTGQPQPITGRKCWPATYSWVWHGDGPIVMLPSTHLLPTQSAVKMEYERRLEE